jgi:quercetin dioxygenase-like cupin family protein
MTEERKSNIDSALDASVGTITDLVAFQDAGITSRTIVESPATVVTIFAFDAGQALSEHSAPFNALVQVIKGKLEITIGGRPNTVGEGQMIIMPADIPHALRAAQKSIMILTMAKGA